MEWNEMKWNAMAWYEMQSADKQRNGSTDKEHGYRRKMQLLTRAKGEKTRKFAGTDEYLSEMWPQKLPVSNDKTGKATKCEKIRQYKL